MRLEHTRDDAQWLHERIGRAQVVCIGRVLLNQRWCRILVYVCHLGTEVQVREHLRQHLRSVAGPPTHHMQSPMPGIESPSKQAGLLIVTFGILDSLPS